MDVFEFAKRVETDEKALEYAFELGLVRKTAPNCPLCNNEMKWQRGAVRRGVSGNWRCCNKIHKKTSLCLFEGSVLKRFQVPISSFLKAIYCIAQEMTIDEALANTKLSRMTYVRIHNMIRGYMQKYNAIPHKRVGGQGMVVEIDECHLHSRK